MLTGSPTVLGGKGGPINSSSDESELSSLSLLLVSLKTQKQILFASATEPLSLQGISGDSAKFSGNPTSPYNGQVFQVLSHLQFKY